MEDVEGVECKKCKSGKRGDIDPTRNQPFGPRVCKYQDLVTLAKTVFFPKPRGQALGGGLEFGKCDDVIVTAFGNFLHWFPAKLTVNQAQSTPGAHTVPAVSTVVCFQNVFS